MQFKLVLFKGQLYCVCRIQGFVFGNCSQTQIILDSGGPWLLLAKVLVMYGVAGYYLQNSYLTLWKYELYLQELDLGGYL